jgi:8-oxo-dGTP pyrophosphatase MutT (NUDIX family)
MKSGNKWFSTINAVLRSWWRMSRGLTLGAQGIVIDDRSRILLVRHGYRPGWSFPGGGVERGETVETALARELEEEAGIRLTARPALHGVFSNNANFACDHIAVYIVRSWEQPAIPGPNCEITAQGFFAHDELPAATDAGTRRRLDEIFDQVVVGEDW